VRSGSDCECGCSIDNCSHHNNLTIKRPAWTVFKSVGKVGEIERHLIAKDTNKDTAGSGRLPERGNGAKVLGNERFAKSNRESLRCEGRTPGHGLGKLEADAARLTDAQRAELDYRIARHARNPLDVISWEQVRAGLFKKP
jgi:Putative addiction module component